MKKTIAIRREDKNEWERRVPLIPEDVAALRGLGIKTILQPSAIRIFREDDYLRSGAEVREDLNQATAIFAVKEVPPELILENKVYTFFSHTIKGQSYNMPMLKELMRKKCSLIDYERIVDEQDRRLIFFGRFAGLAGMIDSLHALGQKLWNQGHDNPLRKVKMAYQYHDLEEAKREIALIGKEIEEKGLPLDLAPYPVAFCGYGNVSKGAQEIFDLLPHKVVSPQILAENYENFSDHNFYFYKMIFKEEDMFRRKDGAFDLQEYFHNPEHYENQFDSYLPYITMMINCIYWTERYPRLVTRKFLQQETLLKSNLKLLVIGDISCDIDGSVEITKKATKPDNAFFTYFPETDSFEDGVPAKGVTVMAVDNLPCEFSKESSREFSKILKNFVPEILGADFSRPFAELALPYPLKKALILYNGELTPDYEYLKENLSHQGGH